MNKSLWVLILCQTLHFWSQEHWLVVSVSVCIFFIFNQKENRLSKAV
jgi:hypothetical protein